MGAPRKATLYRVKETQPSSTTTSVLLTRGGTQRAPDATLKDATIDILAGSFWVENLPEFFLNPTNEAFMEITVTTNTKLKQSPELSYPFKFEMDVDDESFCADIAGAEILSGIVVGPTGIHFRISLTEIDKNNQEKLDLTRKFVEDNKIAEVANLMLAGSAIPVNANDIIKVLFNTVKLIDELNEDDLVWTERPKLDLRKGADNPLYEGWYALVMTPENGKSSDLPIGLHLAGGQLYKSYTSDEKNEPFTDQTYLTWQVLRREG